MANPQKTVWRLCVVAILMVVWFFVSLGYYEGKFTPFYRVKEKYGVVVTTFSGSKRIDCRVGLHSRIGFSNPKNWVASVKSYS
ncbi:hypothetical protein D6821_02585 [Candidatus Parcubacteria bacterium]|nr:MAG: hypothetical protein D6821_02585 [Candidatus Parcubacteria bacterium]